jgi:choline dehydrogenase-like flavoprotein
LEAGGSELLSRLDDSYHHMGATRMSSSSRTGVVDPDLRLFGIRNGYVCSTSVFPTSGFSNPTHTLIALAARLAEHLAADMSRHETYVAVASGVRVPLLAQL